MANPNVAGIAIRMRITGRGIMLGGRKKLRCEEEVGERNIAPAKMQSQT